ncbi:MAG: hypothetical protein AB1765_09535 [Candidatus Hydrogenedentota bacterium]
MRSRGIKRVEVIDGAKPYFGKWLRYSKMMQERYSRFDNGQK